MVSQGISDTLRYLNLAEVALGLVVLRGSIHMCACVSEDLGRGENDVTLLTDILRNTTVNYVQKGVMYRCRHCYGRCRTCL